MSKSEWYILGLRFLGVYVLAEGIVSLLAGGVGLAVVAAFDPSSIFSSTSGPGSGYFAYQFAYPLIRTAANVVVGIGLLASAPRAAAFLMRRDHDNEGV